MKLKSYLRGLGLGIMITTVILVVAFIGRSKNYSDEEIISRAYELGMVETSMYGSSKVEETTPQSIEVQSSETDSMQISGTDVVGTEESGSVAESVSTQEPTSIQEPTSAEETTLANEPTQPVVPAMAGGVISAATIIRRPMQSETTIGETTTDTTTTENVTEPVETTGADGTNQGTAQAAQGERITLLFEDISTATKASEILFNAGLIDSVEGFNEYLSQNGLATRVGEGEFEFTVGMSYEEIAAIVTRTR